MARIGKKSVVTGSRREPDTFMVVEFTVNVNVDGEFTTTLEPADVETIKSFGIKLRYNRAHREGYFSAKTLDDLSKQISSILSDCMSRVLIEEKIVLNYSLATVASFGFTMEGGIIPNLAYHYDGDINTDLYWQKGSVESYSSSPKPIGVQMYICPMWKRVFRYRKGNEKT
ncbi:MAG: hypothetical protein KAU20_04805, partial [Nanoarchaeota archaeon]|nr:hypothetical protein [Nanoarchaeota archaeon]